MPKHEITPNVFDKIEADYRMALIERRKAMIRQNKELKWTQREIAKYWGVDIARVNRIIKTMEVENEK